MKAITQRESVVTYIKSCLIFQIPRFMLISKHRVISPLSCKKYTFVKEQLFSSPNSKHANSVVKSISVSIQLKYV